MRAVYVLVKLQDVSGPGLGEAGRYTHKHRSKRTFAVGVKVWLKLQPYVQTSVARRASHKLAFKYFGHYEVEGKIGSMAYKLKLPAKSTVHPVFHVLLLKKVAV